jgi:DNA-binding MarR family transcriptional regulator
VTVVRRRPRLTLKLMSKLEQEPSYGYAMARELGVGRHIVAVMLRKLQGRLLIRMKRMELPKLGATPRVILELTNSGKKKLAEMREQEKRWDNPSQST